MKLITTDEQLRLLLPNVLATAEGEPTFLLLPNVLATAEGEPTLIEKLYPFLETAEQWAIESFLPESLFDEIAASDSFGPGERLLFPLEKLVACHAYMTAIPSLDLVLTPNGFGIVSNQTIAPASRERYRFKSDHRSRLPRASLRPDPLHRVPARRRHRGLSPPPLQQSSLAGKRRRKVFLRHYVPIAGPLPPPSHPRPYLGILPAAPLSPDKNRDSPC